MALLCLNKVCNHSVKYIVSYLYSFLWARNQTQQWLKQFVFSPCKIKWFNLSLIQHKLEGGLLALGQFQHALDELLAWMSHTEELLNEQKNAGGDPKAIEIELAKHNVWQTSYLVFFLGGYFSNKSFQFSLVQFYLYSPVSHTKM